MGVLARGRRVALFVLLCNLMPSGVWGVSKSMGRTQEGVR